MVFLVHRHMQLELLWVVWILSSHDWHGRMPVHAILCVQGHIQLVRDFLAILLDLGSAVLEPVLPSR